MSADEPVQFGLTMPEDLQGGVYANMANVWHTAHEFTIDFFAQALPGSVDDGAGGQVVPFVGVSRVRVPPSVIFELARAISINVDAWEQSTGRQVPSSEGPGYSADGA